MPVVNRTFGITPSESSDLHLLSFVGGGSPAYFVRVPEGTKCVQNEHVQLGLRSGWAHLNRLYLNELAESEVSTLV